MKRIPFFATILVSIAIAAMIALGVWQLGRREEKEALLVKLAANVRRPAIAFPTFAQGDDLLFRRASALCLEPVGWQSSGGRDAKGDVGWRQIVRCRTGAEGPGFMVQLGVAHSPNGHPAWKGGRVSGYISHAPSALPMIMTVFSHTPRTLMLVADQPVAGLERNPPPDLSSVPNNHLAYAVQWFAFAVIAGVIYLIALRRRTKSAN